MWGIVPAAGNGMRIQPLAFSKELLPVGSRTDSAGIERPRAVSEYLVERMMRAGARKICFVISPWKSDILQYYGGSAGGVEFAYVIQSQASGLCDAIFCALPLIHPDEPVLIGLPDTVWFPEDALNELPDDRFSFLLFQVERPELFDAVVMDNDRRVLEIQVKSPQARSNWVWGAFKMPGHVLHALHALWLKRGRQDEYVGTLVNAWIEQGGAAYGVSAGERYVDVGTLGGYREAIRLLGDGPPRPETSSFDVRPAHAREQGFGQIMTPAPARTEWTPDRVRARAAELGPWFHNIQLKGVWTAPEHFLGDYPNVKWRRYADAIPHDLRGKTVLDIGCNGGFFSMEMKRRGAGRVLGIDFDDDYLAQARFAAEVEGLDIEFRRMSVYDIGAIGERFDIVFFIGVFYHLRHPLLALDLIHEHVARDLLVFQSMQRGSTQVAGVAADYPFSEEAIFDDPGYPKMHFIEHRYSADPTNWWAPNRACTEAVLRSTGFEILSRPEEETYLCRRVARPDAAYGPVYPARGTRTHD